MKAANTLILKTTLLSVLLASAILSGCSTNAVSVAPMAAQLGHASSLVQMESQLDKAGPINLTTVTSADWAVPLSGLLNLNDPQVKSAGITERVEPVQVFLHVLQHPVYGKFLIDTGVSAKLVADPDDYGIDSALRQGLNFAQLKQRQDTAQVLNGAAVQGIFLTHLHLDHILGLPDIAKNVPVYTGMGEFKQGLWLNTPMQPPTDALLKGRLPLREWDFSDSNVVDIFGDQSAFAISSPGHTAGSTVYLIRTPQGPVLLTGDTSHTRWGWEHGVEPGAFTHDLLQNRSSLEQLISLVKRHPTIQVRLGHQP